MLPVNRYSEMKIIAGAREELNPVQIRDHIFLILKVKEIFLTIHVQKGSLKVKKGGGSTPS